MLPKRLKLKKMFLKVQSSNFHFLIVTFFGSILSQRNINISEIRKKILNLLIPKIPPQRRVIKFYYIEPQIRKKPLKTKKNTFSKIVLEIFSQFKNI
jgi:hypothetical protein